jgi:hypothetical protein
MIDVPAGPGTKDPEDLGGKDDREKDRGECHGISSLLPGAWQWPDLALSGIPAHPPGSGRVGRHRLRRATHHRIGGLRRFRRPTHPAKDLADAPLKASQ